MTAWVAEWRALIEKLITSSREGIRNASKFALALKAHAEEVVQMIIERMNELAARERLREAEAELATAAVRLCSRVH